MKKTAVLLALGLGFAGCGSNLRLTAYDPALKNPAVRQAGIVQLKGARYPMHHNIAPVKKVDFPSLCMTALEKSLEKKRKGWKIIPPSTITAADPDIGDFIPLDQRSMGSPDSVSRGRMAKAAATLENRLFLVIENISVKNVSSPQAPAMMVVGACLDLWDFEKGRLLYRARNVSRSINYGDENFQKGLESALYDLFSELVSPLPR
jgi:hypothetical protein